MFVGIQVEDGPRRPNISTRPFIIIYTTIFVIIYNNLKPTQLTRHNVNRLSVKYCFLCFSIFV